MNGDFPIGFSVILCTHNGKSRLEPTLIHLAGVQIPQGVNVELIVVNNASTDGTELFAVEKWQELGSPFPLNVLHEERPGKGYAVEKGYDAAAYSYILTVDDDNWLDSEYLINIIELYKSNPQIGVLQGRNVGVFENSPPQWAEELKQYFIIGSPKKDTGYFDNNNFFVWGAGMVILKADWEYLRRSGFSFLTSKIPGKAAGEDNETAIGLLMLGRKIYYSDKLTYKHFIPAGRVKWEKMKQNFEVFGYVSHYYFLYSLVFDSYEKGYSITSVEIWKKFLKFCFKSMKRYTLKQHLAFWIKPQQEIYQLYQAQMYSQIKWFFKLIKNSKQDIRFLQSWIIPILEQNPNNFKWPH